MVVVVAVAGEVDDGGEGLRRLEDEGDGAGCAKERFCPVMQLVWAPSGSAVRRVGEGRGGGRWRGTGARRGDGERDETRAHSTRTRGLEGGLQSYTTISQYCLPTRRPS